jgi:diguanylate cyclase (GGDEF)-like protein
MNDTLNEALKKAAIFKNFTEDELDDLKALASKITVPANTVFIQENAEDRCFYLLLSGDLVITKKGQANAENIIASLSGVRLLGETGLLAGEQRTASVKTVQSSTLLKFDAEGIKKNPKIYMKILDNIAHELSRKLRDTASNTSEQIEKTDDMKKILTLDSLTGTFNRRYLMDLLKTLEEHALRYNSIFSFLMIDIDDFKKINDTYGHPAGDAALKTFAETCQQITRKPDCVCRYGGEEFVVILHNCSINEALISGNRIREAINSIIIPHEDGDFKFSVSIGISSFHAPYDSTERLISRADEALYQAKHQGKNQVCTKENTN